MIATRRVCLITSAIRPCVDVAVFDRDQRIEQTLGAIENIYSQNVFDKVILIDGSGVDLYPYLEARRLPRGWIEARSFCQNLDGLKVRGYGYGETTIYDKFAEMFGESETCVYKISGRYSIDNLTEIMRVTDSLENFYFTFYPRFFEYRKYVHTAFFKSTTRDIAKHAEGARSVMRRNPGMPLEAAMYFAVTLGATGKRWVAAPAPIYKGIAGGSGRSLDRYYFPYSLSRRLSFLPCMAFTVF